MDVTKVKKNKTSCVVENLFLQLFILSELHPRRANLVDNSEPARETPPTETKNMTSDSIEFFISSDPKAIAPHTNKAIYLKVNTDAIIENMDAFFNFVI